MESAAWVHKGALNGSVLLSESPHGYDEPMRGRYAFLQDSPALIRLGIERLRQVLGITNVDFVAKRHSLAIVDSPLVSDQPAG